MARDLRVSVQGFRSASRELGRSGSGSGNRLEDYYIPDYILLQEPKVDKELYEPACPVIVFINSKSGGQLGGELLQTYQALLNKNQVFDLWEKAPDKVLHQLYINIEKLKQYGDVLAAEIEKRLKIIVAGGDGTSGWLLGVVCDLKLPRSPPVATVPLGTGNNLPFAIGWGKKNPTTDRQAVEAFLYQVKNAKEMKIDSWHIMMQMRIPKEGSCDPIAPLDLPHSLHAFHRVAQDDTLDKNGFHTFRGGFWNYFSMDSSFAIKCGGPQIRSSDGRITYEQAFSMIGKQEGIKGYCRGNFPQVIRVIPYSAFQMFAYETYKKLFRGKDGELPVIARLAAGACAGMTSTFLKPSSPVAVKQKKDRRQVGLTIRLPASLILPDVIGDLVCFGAS